MSIRPEGTRNSTVLFERFNLNAELRFTETRGSARIFYFPIRENPRRFREAKLRVQKPK